MKILKTAPGQALLVVFCLPCAAGNLADPPYVRYDKPLAVHELVQRRLQELLPADAIQYLEGHMACEHWFGEEAYDRARGKEIEAGIKRDCAARDARKKKIHLRYKPGSAVRKRLDRIVADTERYRHDFVWDDPEMRSEALRMYYESTAQDLIRHASVFSAGDSSLVDADREEQVRRLEKRIRLLLPHGRRLHPDTQRNIEAEYKRIRALCPGTATCARTPRTEIHNIHEYCRKDKTDPAFITTMRRLGLKDNGYNYSGDLERRSRTDPYRLEIHYHPDKIWGIEVFWPVKVDEPELSLSFEDIQELTGPALPRRGAKEIQVAHEPETTRYTVTFRDDPKFSNLAKVVVTCAKDSYDVCGRINFDCFGHMYGD